MKKSLLEILGGLITSLITIKGLSLLSSVLIAFYLGQTKSEVVLLSDLVLTSYFMLPMILGLIVLLTLAITFSLCFPKNNGIYLFLGFSVALLIAYAFSEYFLGRVGSFNIWLDLLMGIGYILIAILIGRLSTKHLLTTNS